MPVSLVRAIDPKKLVPLRDLLKRYQAEYPDEPRLRPTVRSYDNNRGQAIFYEFYGQQVSPSTALFQRALFYGPAGLNAPRSEVAVLSLEQNIGKNDHSQNDPFSVDWGLENPRSGEAYWDTKNDRIAAITKGGLLLAIQGTNLFEAAVALPLMRAEALKQAPRVKDKIGIGRVEAVFAPPTYLAKAASPLQIIITVPNLANFDPILYQKAIKNGFELALTDWLTPQ